MRKYKCALVTVLAGALLALSPAATVALADRNLTHANTASGQGTEARSHGAASTAAADPDAAPRADGSAWLLLPVSDATVQAFDCSAGDMCVWQNTSGTGPRCAWTNADPDWRGGTVQCSWSGASPVTSIYNHGVDTSFVGVCLYRGANYTGFEVFVPQGAIATNPAGAFLRSHRWIRSGASC